jgi:hypothetical protein
MERALAPMLFQDDDKEAAEASRTSPVAPAVPSASTLSKVTTNKTPERLPVHSFQSLLADLATIAASRITPIDTNVPGFTLITTLTPVQRRAFDLLGVSHRLGYV